MKLAVCAMVFFLLAACKDADSIKEETAENIGKEDLTQADVTWEKNITEETIYIPGLAGEYNFLYVTDTHMIVPDAEDSEEVTEHFSPRFEEFKNEEGIPAAEQFRVWVDYANEQKVDAFLLGGDAIDYPSESNLKHLESNLSELQMPYLYAVGNHDWTYPWDYMTEQGRANYLPLLAPYMKENTAIHALEMEGLIVVAVDNSTNQITPEAMEEYQQILQKGKPVIVMLHVPLLTQSVLAKAKEVWSSPVVLGGGNYGGIYPDETSAEFINLTTAEESPVVAVLAGHVHFYDKDLINENIVQIVGDAGFKGEAVWITVTGKE